MRRHETPTTRFDAPTSADHTPHHMSERRLLRVLGPTLIEHEGERRPVRGLAGEVACLLTSRYPAAVPTDLIAEALWPDRAPKESRAGLRVALHRLRQLLGGPETVVHENDGYRLALAADEIDQVRFESVAQSTEPVPAQVLGDALELWRGAAYEPFVDQDFLQSAAAQLDALKLDAEEKHVDALLLEGRPDIAATAASRLVDDQPYRERRWELFMLALYRAGRQSEALDVAGRARSRLRDDLGIEPGPALQKLELAILNHDPELQSETPAAPGLGDLVAGLRELKAGPPRITTSFVGRDGEVERIGELLDTHDCVTVVGPPGAGKTRLASRLCGGLGDQRVVWVDLVGVDVDTLVGALAGRLGLVGAGAVEIVTALRRTPTVVVFDNAEHIVAPVASLVEALLQACDELTILVTSRHRLDIGAETVVDLGPLEPSAAAVLLRQRAFGDSDPARRPPIEDLTRAVERLDCYPLHIELLAPLLRERSLADALDLVTVAQSNAVGGARHANLAAAVDWSIRVLSAPAAELHALLGVFEGPFEAVDAAAVLGAASGTPTTASDTGEAIAELVRHSLVQVDWSHTTPLYRQAAGVREHARTVLAAAGSLDDYQAAHSAHFRTEAALIGNALLGSDEAAAAARLGRAMPQFDLARRNLVAGGDLQGAADIVLPLWQYAMLALDYPRYRWLLDLVEEDGIEELDQAPELLAAAGMTAWAAANPDDADRLSGEARKLSMSRGVDVPVAALLAAANAASYSEDLQWMTDSFIELWSATETYGTRNDRATVSAMVTLGHVQLGNLSAATGSAKMAMGHAAEIDNPSITAWAIFAVGWAELLEDPTAATRSFLASVRVSRSVGSRWLEGLAISAMVTASLHRGRFDEACQLLPDVLAHWGRTRSIPQLARSSREAVIALHEVGRSDLAAQVLGYAELLSPVHPLLDSDQRRYEEIGAELGGGHRSDLLAIDPDQCWPSIVAVFDSY